MDSATQSPPTAGASQSAPTYHREAMSGGRSGPHGDKTVVSDPQEDHVSETALLTSDFTRPVSPSLTAMSHAHVSEYTTVTTVPRYNHTSPSFHIYDPASPFSSAPSTAHNSRVPSLSFEDPNISRPVLDSLKLRLASGYFAYFVLGWGDGVTGTVMPYLNAEFKLTTMTSSLLWVGTTCGFFAGTFLVETILKYLGRCKLDPPRKSAIPCIPKISNKNPLTLPHSTSRARHLALIIASTFHAFFFIMMGSRGGFPVMFVSYAVSAFARALLTAPLNAYLASCPKRALGFAYGLSSLGSVASSFVCQFIIATGVPWFHFYFGSLVLSGMNVAFLALTFRPSLVEANQERSGVLNEKMKLAVCSTASDGLGFSEASTVIVVPTPSSLELKLESHSDGSNTLKMALRMPYQWAFSMFALLYCGSETTTQGFIIIYLLGTKNANPKTVGYVTSGFWGGISLGRFAWGYCTESGSMLYMSAFVRQDPLLPGSVTLMAGLNCLVLGLVMQVLIWVVASHVQDSIAAGFIGLFYGPVFPAALAMANDILPEEVHMTVMALNNAFASLGGAIFPLVAGTVLSFEGVSTFTPIAVTLTAALVVLWALFPSRIPTITNI